MNVKVGSDIYKKIRFEFYNRPYEFLYYYILESGKQVPKEIFNYAIRRYGITINDIVALIKELDSYYNLVTYSYNGVIFKIETLKKSDNG